MATQKVSIQYLIDVAIGNPEPGVVNFNALYTVLQVISQKLDIQNQNVEIDSSFCPVPPHAHDDRSIISSERLVDHQIHDYGSEKDADFDFKKQDEKKVAFVSQEDRKRDLSQYRSELKQHVDLLNSRLGRVEQFFAASVDAEQNMECLRQNVYQMKEKLNGLGMSIEEVKQVRAQQEQDLSACRKRLEHDRLVANVDSLQHELFELRDAFEKGANNRGQSHRPKVELTNELKADFSRLHTQLMEAKADICSIKDQMVAINERMAAERNTSEMVTAEMLNEELAAVKSFIDIVTAQLVHLQAEHAAHKVSTDDLTEQLNELKDAKMDREEIEELLSEKADYTMLQRKVSVENMTADRRKLDQQLSEITDCFVMNEERVQKQIDDIKKFLGDQSLEDMLFDFKVKVDKDIQVVRDAVKRLAEMKPDVDAAAARLKNLTCLSCDQEVVMRAIELNNLSKFGDAYVTRSISPEVRLELHKLRHAGKVNAVDLSEAICDLATNFRHTGGMHTIITAKDRVEKIKRK